MYFGRGHTGKQLASGLDLSMSFHTKYDLPPGPTPVILGDSMASGIMEEPFSNGGDSGAAHRHGSCVQSAAALPHIEMAWG
jgi:hypothetical protein